MRNSVRDVGKVRMNAHALAGRLPTTQGSHGAAGQDTY